MYCSLAEDLQLTGVEAQTDDKLCSLGEGGTDGKDLPVRTCMCGSAHDCGCVVNGSNAMVASQVLLLLLLYMYCFCVVIYIVVFLQLY